MITERVLVALGSAFIAISPYLPWLRVVLLGSLDLPDLLSISRTPSYSAYLATAIGVALALVALLARAMSTVRASAIGVGALAGLVGGDVVIGLIHTVNQSEGLVGVKVGPILLVIGCVLVLVPPVVGLIREPQQPAELGAPRRQVPGWVPAAGAVLLAAAIVWLPLRASASNYCGTPVGAQFKNSRPIPGDQPPAEVAALLNQDQQAVTAAQVAANGQQATDTKAQQEQAAADALAAQAQQADQAVSDAASKVNSDQSAVDGDQGSVQTAQASVTTDGGTIQADQQTITGDQQTIATDQQTIVTDQQTGTDATYDQQALAKDQQILTRDQQSLATDQQTLGRDQQQLQQAQAQAANDQATLGKDQHAASAAQQSATKLDQQAQTAQSQAQTDGATASSGNSAAAEALSNAQQHLATDSDNWSATHAAEVRAATDYNSALTACKTQSDYRLICSAVIALLGGALTLVVLLRRRHTPTTNGPQTGPIYPPGGWQDTTPWQQ